MHHSKIRCRLAAKGQKPSLPRRSIAVRFTLNKQTLTERVRCDAMCRVEMWRGGCRSNISVSASFVWRCLSGATMTPFPHPSHRTGHEDFPHPALGQDFTPSPTARRAQAGTGARARSTRKGARVDKPRPCAHAVANTPAQRLSALLCSLHPAVSAFPDMAVGSACASSFSRLARRSLALRPAHSRCHRIS